MSSGMLKDAKFLFALLIGLVLAGAGIIGYGVGILWLIEYGSSMESIAGTFFCGLRSHPDSHRYSVWRSGNHHNRRQGAH